MGDRIGLERHERPCGHAEEYWDEYDKNGILRYRSWSDCTPECPSWGGVGSGPE